MQRRRGGGAAAGAPAPFYASNSCRKTSAEIISEARAALYGESNGGTSGVGAPLRALGTRRPFTPRETQRTLCGARAPYPRPPSSFSLRYLRHQQCLSSVQASQDDDRGGDNNSGKDKNSHLDAVAIINNKNARRKTKDQPLVDEVRAALCQETQKMKLPQLTGKPKPLHKRKSSGNLQTSVDLTNFTIVNSEDMFEKKVDSLINETCRPALCGILRKAHSGTKERSVTFTDSPADKQRQFISRKSSSFDLNIRVKEPHQIANPSFQVDYAPRQSYSVHSTYINEYEEEPETAEAILNTLDVNKCRNVSDNQISELILKLYDALETKTQWHSINNKLKHAILSTLYGHIESLDERILIGIARILLAMRVSGSNLAAVCKLIFKVARNDQNDYLFKSGGILELFVEGVARACPLTEGECVVYGGGALRFLALNTELRAAAACAGAVHLATLHLKIINNAKAENPRSMSEQSVVAVYQLTGALRNLAPSSAERDAASERAAMFVDSGALAQLCQTLDLFITDVDIVTNVARTLSVLSAEPLCCGWLCVAPGAVRALVRAMAACMRRAPLVVRLAYTLGNMAACSDVAAISIYKEKDAIDCLLTVMETYLDLYNDKQEDQPEKNSEQCLIGNDLAGSNGSYQDVLVKTIRVLANVCLEMDAGEGLVQQHGERVLTCVVLCCYAQDTELCTSALATLNNLSYYHAGDDLATDAFQNRMGDLCEVVCNCLVSEDNALAEEAVHTLGNLSRSHASRTYLQGSGALEAIVAFLDADKKDVRLASAGVLVNVCGGAEAVARQTAAAAASDALVPAARRRDFVQAALLTRALWNAVAAEGEAVLAQPLRQSTLTLLEEMIDYEDIFGKNAIESMENNKAEDEELTEQTMLLAWEDFASVAINLLDKLSPLKTERQSVDMCVGTNSDNGI